MLMTGLLRSPSKPLDGVKAHGLRRMKTFPFGDLSDEFLQPILVRARPRPNPSLKQPPVPNIKLKKKPKPKQKTVATPGGFRNLWPKKNAPRLRMGKSQAKKKGISPIRYPIIGPDGRVKCRGILRFGGGSWFFIICNGFSSFQLLTSDSQ